MKFIPLLRTKRLTVQLKELSIGASMTLASMPEHLEEAALTIFLNSAIDTVQAGSENPAEWTVQERSFAVAHYLASIMPDGPDFSLGNGKYSDYLDGTADISAAMNQIPIGEVGGDNWELKHLSGVMTEAIERLVGEFDIPLRMHWLFGAMAAQLVRVDEDYPDFDSAGNYDEWLLARIKVLVEFPESDFEQLMGAYFAGREKMHHLFDYNFDDKGIVILPRKGGAEGLPSARFPVRTTLSKMAINMAGKSH